MSSSAHKLLEYPRRVARHHDIRRDVTRDDTAGPNDAIIADRHARVDDGASADPHVVSYPVQGAGK